MANKTISKCPVCGFPITAEHEGQTAICANCGEKLEAIQSSISGPAFGFWPFVIGLTFGVILGPAIIAGTDSGRKWLEKQARR